MNDPKTKEIQNVLDRLQKVRPSGTGYSAMCPAHSDSNPSLSVSLGDGQKVMLNCHKGCTAEQIVESIDLEMKDLWPTGAKGKQKKQWVENYDYEDAEGNLIFQVTRWILPDGRKSFTQRKPTRHGDWEYSTTGLDKPIYRLPQVRSAIGAGSTIVVCEGEKDVHTLEEAGMVATTNPGGAGSWLPRHTKALVDARKVVVIADRDAVGMKHAKMISYELEEEGVPVQVMAAPEGHKDVTAFLESGGELSGLVPVVFEEENLDPFIEVVADIRSLNSKDWSFDKKLARARAVIDKVEFDPGEAGEIVKWVDFLSAPVEPYDWVIPGLLERQERLIVVAAEGVGKTMLARQVALMSAAGISPFKKDRMEPVRTLYIDLENPERIIRRTSAKILSSIKMFQGGVSNLPADLLVKQDGLNILDPKDRVFLERVIEQSDPDILFIGPIYKLFMDPGNKPAESTVGEVTRFLDYIRTTYDCALWLEHHAPFGSSMSGRELRPFGSAVWSRWPEFGIALAPDPTVQYRYDLKHFRGARDEREFPTALTRGEVWPFEAEFDNA